jgi:hypothetical protein
MIRAFIRDNRRYAARSDHNSKRSPRRPSKSYEAAEQQNLRQTVSLLSVPTEAVGRGRVSISEKWKSRWQEN